MSFNNGNKDPMKPDELRNMFIFFIAAAILYFSYDALILQPQKAALKQAELEAQQAATAGRTVDPDGAIIPQQAGGADAVQDLRPRTELVAETQNQRLKIENGKIFGSIALKGARLDDLSFHEYFKEQGGEEAVNLLSPSGAAHMRYVDMGWVAPSGSAINLPDSDSLWQAQDNQALSGEEAVTLRWDNGAGLVFERRIELDENYLFTVTQSVINNTGKKVTLFPYGAIAQKGIPEDFTGVYLMHEGPIGYIGDELVEVKYKTLRKNNVESIQSDQGWVGVTDKYWLTAFVPAQGQNTKYNFNYRGGKKEWKTNGRYQVDYVGQAVIIEPGQSGEAQNQIYAGAKKVLLLEEYGEKLGVKNFDLAVDFGIFWFMTKPFFFALHYLALWIGNMGFAIIALTLIIRMFVFPLTNISYRSFAKMKKISPQVAALRAQHTDKRELQQNLMKLYQSEGVNPMAGCLPMLLQIPIFFALYKTLYISLEIRHAPFIGWIQDLSAPDPTSIFNLFGLIPWTPPGFLIIGVWPCFMLVAMLIQRKLNPPPQDPLQRDMATYFPLIMTFVLAKFPSGLVVYWAFSAWIGLVQQMIIMRSLNVPIHLFGETEAEKSINDDLDQGGPAEHPLIDLAAEEVEDAIFGDHDDDEPKKKVSKPKPKKSKKKK